MKSKPLIAAFFATLMFVSPKAQAACNCGPDFCQDDARIGPLLTEKKAELGKEYPQRLINLLDIGSQCVARVERSPDAFTMWIVNADNSKGTILWSQENEDKAKAKIAAGEVKRFWIFNARESFACCKEKKPEERPDWNEEDELNTDAAILCDRNGCTK